MTPSLKPKVLLIASFPPPYIGPFIANERLIQADNLRSAFDITVLDISDRRPGGNIGSLDAINVLLALKHITQCLKVLIAVRPAVVYLNISQGTWGFLRDLGFVVPALLMRRQVVLHLRGSEFGLFYAMMPAPFQWVTRRVLGHVSKVIILGRNLKGVLRGIVREEQIEIIPNGIACEQSGEIAPRSEAGRGKILYLGSIKRRKGIFPLLEAFAIVAGGNSDVSLTVAGEWHNASEESEAMEYLNRMKLGGKVQFPGAVTGSRKIELYKQHDIFVFTPIEPEGLPWVILEAMSAGLPIVTSNQGAIAEVVQDGRTGFFVEPTPERIADKIRFLLNNRQEATAMGVRGRRRVEREFSEVKCLEAIEQLLRHVISRRPHIEPRPISPTSLKL